MTRNEIGTFGFPAAMLVPGDNVISVLTVDMGTRRTMTAPAKPHRRGIVSAKPIDADAKAITWRLQGAITDENPQRGPYNFGGLYGERQAGRSSPATPPTGSPQRCRSTPPNPRDVVSRQRSARPAQSQDTSLGLEIKDPPGRHYRATIFVNGWQMGNYIADLGPQHRFPIPDGIIDPHGNNDITIAVWKTDDSAGGLGTVSLIDFRLVHVADRCQHGPVET